MTRVVAFLALLTLLAGCGQRSRTADAPVVPHGKLDVPADAVAWAQGSVLHVGDRQVDVGEEIRGFALTTGGAYVDAGTKVLFTDLDRVEPTRFGIYRGLTTSEDMRYLGLLDFDNGPKDGYGTRRAAVVVVDTTTGREVVRDDTLMGDLKEDDLADLYEDAEPAVIGLDDMNIYAKTAEGNDVLRYPLDGSKPEDLGEEGDPATYQPYNRLVGQGFLSPSGNTLLKGAFNDEWRPYDVATKQPLALALDAPRFSLGAWTGPDSFYGLAMTKGRGPAGIVTCDRAQPRCVEVVPASAMTDDPVVLPAS